MDMMLTLKAARVNSGFTQKQAAKEIGVCQKTLSAWESGKRSPRMNQLKIVCQVYGVPYDQIFLPS